MDSVDKWITRVEISSSPPFCLSKKSLALRIVTAEEMRAEGDAESLIEMLVDQDPAFSKRDAQMRRLYLKNDSFKGNGIVMAYGTFFFDRKDLIKIQMMLNGHESRA